MDISMASMTASAYDTAEEDFQRFFEKWRDKQIEILQKLNNASEQFSGGSGTGSGSPPVPTDPSSMVKHVVGLYEGYYRDRSKWADKNVLSMISPPWTSTLEDAFLWIGSWRPTMAIHLLYSKSGLQLEAKLSESILQEIASATTTKYDLADLSASQLGKVDELHRKIITEEKEISEKYAKQQERATDQDMVNLSHMVSEFMRGEEKGLSRRDREAEEEQIKSTLNLKEKGLRKVLKKADDLRLRTLKMVIEIMTPKQAIHFLIAATELQLRLHEWGMAKDARELDYGDAHSSYTPPEQT
ncbi:OLC1v1016276C1 [Oldenlandia corymbosa var. corymbosa]|uniref:OLC1v1016276C1 n=1 Tax=Oldenlandia corymbosa var. corymbosa TaxID=529605 RepID=A0AAV1E6T7_OLDCO|nr:OLC1v1016276C1 [Oldenlandia corymbosa var. corymbosa]